MEEEILHNEKPSARLSLILSTVVFTYGGCSCQYRVLSSSAAISVCSSLAFTAAASAKSVPEEA